MTNFTQDKVVLLTADEVPSWVKSLQIGTYSEVVLTTMVTYDASEFPARLVAD